MSEANYLVELRDAAPEAPVRLRELVRTMPAAERSRGVTLRPALVAAAVIALAIALGASVIGGLTGSANERHGVSEAARAREARGLAIPGAPGPMSKAYPNDTRQLAPSLTAKSRLQRQDVSMRLRVKDLSGATQSAVRTTHRLGGFVAGADYATDSKEGNSRLALRVPVANLQKAIASFTDLGTILSQHISVADLQTGLDRLDARIASARRSGHERALKRLERRREALIRKGTYARVSLRLTTVKPTAQHVAPGRFDRFWDNTSDILGKELIAVLYALVLAGPFVLIAALLFVAERTRRRRADHRLLEETG
jgi:Domain of unknown function (DUF4349)